MTTLKQAKDILRDYAMTLTKRDGEYRVSYNINRWIDLTPTRAEDLASYTSDIDDAIRTGKSMAASYRAKQAMTPWGKGCLGN